MSMTSIRTRRPVAWSAPLGTFAGRGVHALVALPVGLVTLAAACVGLGGPAGRAQRSLVRRLLRVDLPTARPPRAGRVVRHNLAALPANLVTSAVMTPAVVLFVTRGVLYPLVGGDNLEAAWGGPTLAGAWTVHFLGALATVLALVLLLWPVTAYQARLARRHLGG